MYTQAAPCDVVSFGLYFILDILSEIVSMI